MPLKPLLLILTRFKIRTYLGTLILSAMILMPEDTLHFVAVFLHTVYESIAYALEHMLMHNLGATKFQAQMAVFYLSLAIGRCGRLPDNSSFSPLAGFSTAACHRRGTMPCKRFN